MVLGRPRALLGTSERDLKIIKKTLVFNSISSYLRGQGDSREVSECLRCSLQPLWTLLERPRGVFGESLEVLGGGSTVSGTRRRPPGGDPWSPGGPRTRQEVAGGRRRCSPEPGPRNAEGPAEGGEASPPGDGGTGYCLKTPSTRWVRRIKVAAATFRRPLAAISVSGL